MAEVNLIVFETDLNNGRLREVFLGLREDATGYLPGFDVVEIGEVPGAYSFQEHRGTITDRAGLVRVVGSQVWTKKYGSLLERVFRAQRIGYKMGRVRAEDSNTKRRDAEPFELEGRVGVVYTPLKK